MDGGREEGRERGGERGGRKLRGWMGGERWREEGGEAGEKTRDYTISTLVTVKKYALYVTYFYTHRLPLRSC